MKLPQTPQHFLDQSAQLTTVIRSSFNQLSEGRITLVNWPESLGYCGKKASSGICCPCSKGCFIYCQVFFWGLSTSFNLLKSHKVTHICLFLSNILTCSKLHLVRTYLLHIYLNDPNPNHSSLNAQRNFFFHFQVDIEDELGNGQICFLNYYQLITARTMPKIVSYQLHQNYFVIYRSF